MVLPFSNEEFLEKEAQKQRTVVNMGSNSTHSLSFPLSLISLKFPKPFHLQIIVTRKTNKHWSLHKWSLQNVRLKLSPLKQGLDIEAQKQRKWVFSARSRHYRCSKRRCWSLHKFRSWQENFTSSLVSFSFLSRCAFSLTWLVAVVVVAYFLHLRRFAAFNFISPWLLLRRCRLVCLLWTRKR